LFGPLARMPAPRRGRCHLRHLRHSRWLTQSRGRRQGRLCHRHTLDRIQSTSTSLRTRVAAARYPC
jgi:hypothetical protein